jgi:hypothetical protein
VAAAFTSLSIPACNSGKVVVETEKRGPELEESKRTGGVVLPPPEFMEDK